MGVDLAGRPLLYKGRFVSVRPPVGGSPVCCYGSLQYRSDRLRCAPTWGPPFQVRPNMGEPVRLRPNIGATVDQVGGCPTCLTCIRLACRRFPGFVNSYRVQTHKTSLLCGCVRGKGTTCGQRYVEIDLIGLGL